MLNSRVGAHLRTFACKHKHAICSHARSSSSSSSSGRSSTKLALVRVPEARLSQLDNGLRVASEDWNTATCTVGVWLQDGSRSETDATNGASQLLRQLAFSGGRRSAKEIRSQLEERGASVGAGVSRESASYRVTCFSRDLPWAMELLADVVRDSAAFDEERLELRRQAALAELRSAESDLRTVVMDYLHAAAYQATRLSLSPLGQAPALESLTAGELRRFAAGRLRPRRMLVSAAGAVGHSELVDLCRRHFGDLADAADVGDGGGRVRFTGSSLLDRDDQLPYAHVAIAVEGPEAASVDTLPLLVASAYVGGWDRGQGGGANVASRLARQARDAFGGGGVVSYSSFFDLHSDTSLWGMHFVANQESVNYFTKDFQTDWMELTRDVREFDLVRAKNALLTWMYSRLDGTEAACGELARSVLLYGRRVPMREFEERIAGVTAASLSQAASQYIYDRCPAVAAVGPIEGLPDYNRIRGKMWFYRV